MIMTAVYNYFAIAVHCNGEDKIPFGNNYLKAFAFMQEENNRPLPFYHVEKIISEFSHWEYDKE